MLSVQLAAIALAATTVAASGCGGSSKTGSTGGAPTSTTAASATTTATARVASGKPLTRAELLAQADAICKRVNADHELLNHGTQQNISREMPAYALYEQLAFAELSKLTPASMTNDWKRFLAAAQTLASDTARFGGYTKANDLNAAYGILPMIDNDERRMHIFAKRDGLSNCAQVI
jgi:hypothetical protein